MWILPSALCEVHDIHSYVARLQIGERTLFAKTVQRECLVYQIDHSFNLLQKLDGKQKWYLVLNNCDLNQTVDPCYSYWNLSYSAN